MLLVSHDVITFFPMTFLPGGQYESFDEFDILSSLDHLKLSLTWQDLSSEKTGPKYLSSCAI
jgi:hypothetical protein